MDREDRQELAIRRLIRILGKHGVALMRTLEQKISDAGPYNQRIDPHILTLARKDLQNEGAVLPLTRGHATWYHLKDTSPDIVAKRLAEQGPIHNAIRQRDFIKRVGQALEIAVFRSLLKQSALDHFGHYNDLDDHDDSLLYTKEEPPSSMSGNTIPGGKKLDYLVTHPTAGAGGIEVKNVREWFYPNRTEIRDFLLKCCHLDAVPILICRRFPFVTYRLLHPCGVLLHQPYNQRFPSSEQELAERAKDKNLLGYHDIRLGNEPDSRLDKFIVLDLPHLLPAARERFDDFKDLIVPYASRQMTYKEFAARVRRREQGTSEDADFDYEDLY